MELNDLRQDILATTVFDGAFVALVGRYIDLAKKAKSALHTKNAIDYLSLNLDKIQENNEKCLAHYSLSVAWSDIRDYKRSGTEASWEWEQEEVEKEIVNLRQAERLFDKSKSPIDRYCQIQTNLGNLFDYTGRYIESLRCWNKAIYARETFGMAIANKGNSLIYHGLNSMTLRQYQLFFLQVGYRDLKYACDLNLEEHAIQKCQHAVKAVEENYSHLLKEPIALEDIDFESSPKFDLLNWALSENLLLNPFIDIEHYEFALFDDINIPADFDEGVELFDQIKNEYRIAREFYFESQNSSFSNLDKNERLKLSFRVAYSLFDKIAYLVNNIFKLNVPLHRVDFHKIWFENLDKKKGVRPDLAKNNNFILRGLYWISKELYHNEAGFRESIEPDAQEIANIRNYLEHKSIIVGPPVAAPNSSSKFSLQVSQSDLDSKALRLLLLIRECILYIPCAINREIVLGKDTFDSFKPMSSQ